MPCKFISPSAVDWENGEEFISFSFTSVFHHLRQLLSCMVMGFSKLCIPVSSTLLDRSSFLANPLDHRDRTLKLHFELGAPFLEFLERFQLPICSLCFFKLPIKLIQRFPRKSVKSWVQNSIIWIAQQDCTVIWVILCDVVEIMCIVNCALPHVQL